MKKLAFLFAIVAGFLLSSCTNDEIEITSVNELTVNIRTQGVYDTFGSTKSIRERFLAQSYNIGVYTFIYDERGKLAASDSTYSKSFGAQVQKFSLKPGKYTLVTLQMLVDEDNKNLSESWIINHKDDLSRLEVEDKSYSMYWYDALGSTSRTFEIVEGKSANLTLDNKAIGSIVNCRALKFNNTKEFNVVSFYTKDAPEARLLSPNHTGSDRIRYGNYTGERTWVNRGRHLNFNGLEAECAFDIYLLEEGRVNWCFGPSTAVRTSSGGYTINSFTAYPSSNAYFNFSDGGSFWAGLAYMGANATPKCSTVIGDVAAYNSWVNGLGSVTPDPTPAGTYVAPYLTWGASVATVKSYMTDKGFTNVREFVNSSNPDTYVIVCENADETVYYQYQFDNSSRKYNGMLMTFAEPQFTLNGIRSDMSKDFEGGDWDGDLEGYFYYNDKTLALVYEMEYEGDMEIWVQYVPNTSAARKMMRGDVRSFKDMAKAQKANSLKK